jgi:hypothetical protein
MSNNGNLRKFSHNFNSNEAYRKYLEKGKWKQGRALNTANYENLRNLLHRNFTRRVINNNKNNKGKPKPGKIRPSYNIEQLATEPNLFRAGPELNAKLARLREKLGRPNLTPAQLYRMFLHNHALHLEKKSGLSILEKRKIEQRLKRVSPESLKNWATGAFWSKMRGTNHWETGLHPWGDPNNRVFKLSRNVNLNNFPNLKKVLINAPPGLPRGGGNHYVLERNFKNLIGKHNYYVPRSNGGWRIVPFVNKWNNRAVVRIPPSYLNKFPFLAQHTLTRLPPGLPAGTYVPKNKFPANINLSIRQQTAIQKALGLSKSLPVATAKFKNLLARASGRQRFLGSLKEAALAYKEFQKLSALGNGRLYKKEKVNMNGAGPSDPNKVHSERYRLRGKPNTGANVRKVRGMLSTVFGNYFLNSNSNNEPNLLKRKRNTPNSPNTAARKKAKANENKKHAATVAELKRLTELSASLRQENVNARLGRLPPNRALTWRRGWGGHINVVNLNKRKMAIKRLLNLHRAYNKTPNQKILGEATSLVNKLKLPNTNARSARPFSPNTIAAARRELLRILEHLGIMPPNNPPANSKAKKN